MIPMNAESPEFPDQRPSVSLLMPTENSSSIPIIEERVKIEKQVIETGRVVIEKRVTEHQETIPVVLSQEEVTVNRVPVNRYVDVPPEAVRYEGDVLIISVLEEVAVVEKRLMLVEELHITRRQVQTQTDQSVTLRREEATVSREAGPAT